jgi:Skp family chaperone for outer membrane proteins
MKLPAAIFLLLVACLPALAAPPRFAVVRISEIYRELPSTVALQERVKNEREAILADERAENLRSSLSELESLGERLQDRKNPPTGDAATKLAREFEMKRQETQTLQLEFETFRAEQTKRINRMMVENMRSILNRIHSVSTRIAKEEGFDATFDHSGDTNTGLPFVLYSGKAPDLTAKVKAALADSEAATQAN